MNIRLKSKEKEELVTENLRLVHYLVNRMGPLPADYDDVVSVGTIGLVKAAATFDSSKGIKFATYASGCINNEIFMYFRKEKKHANMISIEETINVESGDNEIALKEVIEDPNSDFTEAILQKDSVEKVINIILNRLDSRSRIIMLYTIGGITQKVIGESLNISQSYISRLQKTIKIDLKEYLNNLQNYKGVFQMAITGSSYEITFSSKDVKNFNSIFSTLLESLTSSETLPDFKVICDKERIIIKVPAHPESFSFIAQIIKEIDNYTFVFASNKVDNSKKVENESIEVEEMETDIGSDSSNEPKTSELVKVEEDEIISDNLSTSEEADKQALTVTDSSEKWGYNTKQVRNYMFSKETFTVKELKSNFPNVKSATIATVIQDAKKRGLITSIGRGEYAIVKK